MEGISEHQNCFLIDLREQQVFCRSCRKRCKRLVLPGFTQYWCANHDCSNSGEVEIMPDGTWGVYGVVETWLGNRCSGIESRLLFSRKAENGHQEHF